MIRRARQSRGLSLKALGVKVGCGAPYLSQVENGRRPGPPSEALLRAIEAELGLAEGELVRVAQWQSAGAVVKREAAEMARSRRAAEAVLTLVRAAGKEGEASTGRSLDELYRSGALGRLIDEIAQSEGAGARGAAVGGEGTGASGARPVAGVLPVEVPLINSVAAGYPTEFTDLGYPARVADDYVRTPDIRDPDAFAARVVGDSMEPEFREGDIVVFSPAKAVKSGMDCFVRIEPDHETTFKRVYFEEDGEEASGAGDASRGDGRGLIRLQPLNPRYAPKVVPRERVAGLYAAVSVTRAV
ncbi:MAG: helix-turn-helix domain-containing protein [Phycisphaerae bacterium]|nr:helix-turn-helix domain-containing protein [Phycisphaerae bacterium]